MSSVCLINVSWRIERMTLGSGFDKNLAGLLRSKDKVWQDMYRTELYIAKIRQLIDVSYAVSRIEKKDGQSL